jgi:DNA polymerase-3 subunit beta
VACIPAEKLRDCLSRATGDTVAVDCGGGRASVRSGGAAYNLFCADPGTWPFPEDAAFPEPLGTVHAAALRRIIDQCLPFTDKAATRYTFDGVLFTVKRQSLVVVATEGHRLAKAETHWPGKPFSAAIVPTKALKDMLPNLPDDGDVGVWFGGADGEPPAAAFAVPDGYALRTGLVEGQFPPYEDIIPADQGNRLESDRDALLGVVAQAAVFVPDDGTTAAVRLSLSAGHGLRVSARDPMAGDGEAILSCKYSGPDMELGRQRRLPPRRIAACEGPGVTVDFYAPNRTCVVRDAGSPFVALVMPVNLQ